MLDFKPLGSRKAFDLRFFFCCSHSFSLSFLLFFLFYLILFILSSYLIPIDFNQNANRESYFHRSPYHQRIEPSNIWKHEIQAKSFCRFDQFYMFAMANSHSILLRFPNEIYSQACSLSFFLSLSPPPAPVSVLALYSLSMPVNLLAISTLLSYLAMKTCLVFILHT